MKGKTARKRISQIKKRPSRRDPGTREELMSLARSWLQRAIHPIIVSPDLDALDGNRRLQGIELLVETKEMSPDPEIEVFITDEVISADEAEDIAFESAWHRAPLGGYDQAVLLLAKRERNPAITNKDLAARLHIDPSMPTKLLSLFDCIPEVIEDAKVGAIGLREWYAISQLDPDEQPILLTVKRNGGTTQRVEEEGRKLRKGATPEPENTEKAESVKFDLSADIAIAVKAKNDAKGLTLADVAAHLLHASREATKAKEQGLSVKSFSNVMRDRAKKPKADPAKGAS